MSQTKFEKKNRNPPSKPMGPPVKVSQPIVEEIDERTFQDPHIGAQKLAKVILEKLGIRLSAPTINKIRAELHYTFKFPRKRSFLTSAHISKRIKFCEKAKISETPQWDANVVFSDESRFCFGDDSRRISMKRGIYAENTL